MCCKSVAQITYYEFPTHYIRLQAPGAWHSVYSPTKGVTTGTHLVMYDALHLTERSRAYDDSPDSEGVRRGSYATNESHAIDRQILRMMLGLPDLVETRGMQHDHFHNT
jgi:hypothetical protein